MLATLERPTSRPLVGAEIRIVAPLRPSVSSVPLPSRPAECAPRTTALAPTAPSGGTRLLPAQAPFTRPRPVIGNAAMTSLRMTVRARRLLATLVLLCCAGLGIVAADVFSALAQHLPAASYPAQEAPYAEADSGGSAEFGDSGNQVPAGPSITVLPGDSLWTLAQRIDPDADPRRVIAAIMRLNELETPTVHPGQILFLP